MQRMMYNAVSFMIAATFYFSAWNCAFMARMMDGTGVLRPLLELAMVAFLVLWALWVGEGMYKRYERKNRQRRMARRRGKVMPKTTK